MMLSAIWYHLPDLKDMKNIHGGVLIVAVVKLQTEASSTDVSHTFEMYKWYQYPQSVSSIHEGKQSTISSAIEDIIAYVLFRFK